jgi:predicted phage tail protein
VGKEKATKELSVKVQPSLYDRFAQQCQANYRSVSDVIRELMTTYSPIQKRMLDEMNNSQIQRMLDEMNNSPIQKMLDEMKGISDKLAVVGELVEAKSRGSK